MKRNVKSNFPNFQTQVSIQFRHRGRRFSKIGVRLKKRSAHSLKIHASLLIIIKNPIPYNLARLADRIKIPKIGVPVACKNCRKNRFSKTKCWFSSFLTKMFNFRTAVLQYGIVSLLALDPFLHAAISNLKNRVSGT